nr:hypothetical protein Iba_chr07fCG3070 [Ipomoea batatas]
MCLMGSMKNSCKAEITDLDLSKMAIDKNVVALEISVDHRRIMAVLHQFHISTLSLSSNGQKSSSTSPNYEFHVETKFTTPFLTKMEARNEAGLPSERAGSEHLGDEIEGPALDINPRRIEPDDGSVSERAQKMHLRVKPLQILGRL